MHEIAFGEEQFREIRTILTGDAGDEGYLGGGGRWVGRHVAPLGFLRVVSCSRFSGRGQTLDLSALRCGNLMGAGIVRNGCG